MSQVESMALSLVQKLTNQAINGVGPLSSAAELAQEYVDKPYSNDDARVNALIKWESTKNFASGFLTGLGGLITLPVSIPASLGASWVVQGRMSAAIAKIYDHDIHDDRIRTMVLVSCLGQAGAEWLRNLGVQVGQQLSRKAIAQIPGRVLIEINKKVGMRLLTKAGQKGAVNFMKIVPFVGGVVGGTIDGGACYAVGTMARSIFKREAAATEVKSGDERPSETVAAENPFDLSQDANPFSLEELADLSDSGKTVVKYLSKMAQADGKFDETEKELIRWRVNDLGELVTEENVNNLADEAFPMPGTEILAEIQGHAIEIKENLILASMLVAIADGCVDTREKRLLAEALPALGISKETYLEISQDALQIMKSRE